MLSKFIKKIIITFGLIVSPLTLSSCSMFFGSSGYLISDITSRVDDEGNTILTITFDDESIEPKTITIPKGISGDPGIGIDHIEHSLSDDNILTLTIYYTDDSLEPTVIEIPVVSGTDGRGIEDVILGNDELGNTTIVFRYSDGTESEVITVNKGIDGKDGNGIKDITTRYDEATNSTIITISYDDEEMEDSVFSIPNGEDGTSITSITSSDNGSTYLITINFSDGTNIPLFLDKPTTNKWLSGNGLPSNSLGNDNDFYFNNLDGSVYQKISGYWNLLFSMSGTGTEVVYQVSFNLNGGSWRYSDSLTPGDETNNRTMIVNKGEYINLDDTRLEAYYNEHTFNGWWTDIELTPNSGHFTKLTSVNADLTLYANWISNE